MKVLFYDIETSNLAANFGFMLCLSYKWEGQSKVHTISIRQSPTFKEDSTNDLYILEAFRPIAEEADVIVGHYATRFDYPYLQTRCLFHNIPFLPTDMKHIDTWRVARNRLRLNSNRLASLAEHLDAGEKTKLDGRVWVKAMAGHVPSLKYIEQHCVADVLVLEGVYHKIKALRTTATGPKISVSGNCPSCGSGDLHSRGKVRTVKRVMWRRSCNNCGHWYSMPDEVK